MNKDNIGECLNVLFKIIKDVQCPICLDVMRTVVELSCKHLLCKDCYLAFKMSACKLECPLCKCKLNPRATLGKDDFIQLICNFIADVTFQIQANTDEDVETLLHKVGTVDKSTEQFKALFVKFLGSESLQPVDCASSITSSTNRHEDLVSEPQPSTSTGRRDPFPGNCKMVMEKKTMHPVQINSDSSSDGNYDVDVLRKKQRLNRRDYVKRVLKRVSNQAAFETLDISVQPSTSSGVSTAVLGQEIGTPRAIQNVSQKKEDPTVTALQSAEQILMSLDKDLEVCETNSKSSNLRLKNLASNIIKLKNELMNLKKSKCDADTQTDAFPQMHQVVQTEPNNNEVSTQTISMPQTVNASCQTDSKPINIDIACQCSVDQLDVANQTVALLKVEQSVQATVGSNSIEVQTEVDCLDVAVQTITSVTTSTDAETQTKNALDGNSKKSSTGVSNDTKNGTENVEVTTSRRVSGKRNQSSSLSPDEATGSKIRCISLNPGNIDSVNLIKTLSDELDEGCEKLAVNNQLTIIKAEPTDIDANMSSESYLNDVEMLLTPPTMFKDTRLDADDHSEVYLPAEVPFEYPLLPSTLCIVSQDSLSIGPSQSISPDSHQVDIQQQKPATLIISEVTQIEKPNFPENGGIKPGQPICISHSRLKPEEVQMIKKLCFSKNLRYSEHLTSSVTHLVVLTKENHRIHNYTMKYVTAIASGIWIVRYEWIVDSLEDYDLKPEESYEALDVSGIDGPKKSRMTRTTNPLFKNYVFYCSTFINSKRENIEDLVQLLGGSVISSPKSFNDLNYSNHIRLILLEPNATQDYEHINEWLETYKVITLDLDWFIRSIGRYTLLNIRNYILHENDELPMLNLLRYPSELVEPEAFTVCNPEPED